MKKNNNIRTMEYIGKDDWSNNVYKCIEDSKLYKNEELANPTVYTCCNKFDGEMGFPIDTTLEIKFINIPVKPTQEEKFNYMMLSRLKMDCNYYLGNGDRYAKRLWAGSEVEQIKEMKRLYNSFEDDKKPEWLTLADILQYEKLMIQQL